MTLALYGVVRAGHPLPDGASMRLIERDALAVVATDSPVAVAAQLAAVSALVLAGPVLPLRFGTIAVDEDAVRADVLDASAAHLAGELDRLDGLAEVHIRLRFDEDLALAAVHAECGDRIAATRGAGSRRRLEVARFIAERVAAWRQARTAELLTDVFRLARDQVCLGTAEFTEERWAFLVELKELDAVRDAVARIAGTVEVEIAWAGPLPAYSFLAADAPPKPASRWGW